MIVVLLARCSGLKWAYTWCKLGVMKADKNDVIVILNSILTCHNLKVSHLFWTDWGEEPHIGRADMDGKNRRIIIRKNLRWPNGLTIDRPTNRIIWADAQMEVNILFCFAW